MNITINTKHNQSYYNNNHGLLTPNSITPNGSNHPIVGINLKELAKQSDLGKTMALDMNQFDQSMLDKEIRASLFPLFHSVLKSPPSNLVSPTPHNPGCVLLSAGGNHHNSNHSTPTTPLSSIATMTPSPFTLQSSLLMNGSNHHGNGNGKQLKDNHNQQQQQQQQDQQTTKGFLYLFDKHSKDYYLNDGIKWVKTKSNVRMIVITDDKAYKLKTHKKDTGEHTMRRQTYNGICNNQIVWKKFEYKLVKKEGKDGGNEKLFIQEFPLLVHYLTRPTEENDTDQPIVNTLNNLTNLNNNNLLDTSTTSSLIQQQQQQQILQQPPPPIIEEQIIHINNEKKRESSFLLPSLTSSSILSLFTKKKKKDDGTNTLSTSVSLSNSNNGISNLELFNQQSNSFISHADYSNSTSGLLASLTSNGGASVTNDLSSDLDDNYFLDFTDHWSNNNNNNLNNNSNNNNIPEINNNNGNHNGNEENINNLFNTTNNNNNNVLETPSTHLNRNHPFSSNINNLSLEFDQQQQTNESNIKIESSPTTTITTTTITSNLIEKAKNNDEIFITNSSPLSSTPPIGNVQQSTTNSCANISSYSPDTSPSLEQTKIICLVNGFTCFSKNAKVSPLYYSFWAVFEGGIEILALAIAPGVLEFHSPIWGEAAITHFHIVCKQNGSKNIIEQTSPVPFSFTPGDHRGKLKIAFDRCKLSSTLQIIPKFKHSVKHLDLSNNALTNIDFISGFYRLESLVLSNNKLTELTVFPVLPELSTLDLSNNLVNFPKVGLFIDRLLQSIPYLQVLNLADNEEYPCPFKAPHHHYNYRIYVISRFPLLTKLDLQAVSEEERKHAHIVEEFDNNN